MWHGTSLTDPKKIYDSGDGFTAQFANENGYWGKAVYFAVNASYSCGDSKWKGYAYELPDGYKLSDESTLSSGTKVVIFSKVIIGKAYFSEEK